MQNLKMVAPCLFGIESVVASDLKRMGAEKVVSQNGRVTFEGDFEILARANIQSYCAERILIELGSFDAYTFDELFEKTKALPWENWIGKRDAFPVKGKSINSSLKSIPDCQKIIKKAVVKRLEMKYQIPWFEESGTKYQIQFFIIKDNVSLMIDTSGESLYKRGYRENSVLAPIKETLAAAICDIVRVRPNSVVYDPFCGSGTFLIESAYRAMRIAPGLRRSFACEEWHHIPKDVFMRERARANDFIRTDCDFHAYGSDIDADAVSLTIQNAKKAIISKRIDAECISIEDINFSGDRGLVICNPPYGERLLDIDQARKLYKKLGEKCIERDGWSYAIISPDEEFEDYFGRKANKKRKLYNGMIQCNLYIYF